MCTCKNKSDFPASRGPSANQLSERDQIPRECVLWPRENRTAHRRKLLCVYDISHGFAAIEIFLDIYFSLVSYFSILTTILI